MGWERGRELIENRKQNGVGVCVILSSMCTTAVQNIVYNISAKHCVQH